MQVLVDWLDGCRFAEVDADAVAHDGFAVQELTDSDCGIDVVEGGDNAAEGF